MIIVGYGPRGYRTLFLFGLPKCELLGLALAIPGDLLLTLSDSRVVLSRIGLLSGVVKNLDAFLNVACSSVTFITMAKETGSFQIDRFDIGIPLDLVTVRCWVILAQLSLEKRSSLDRVLLDRVRILRMVHFLIG